MIRCSKCGYVGAYVANQCPDCKNKFILNAQEIGDKIAEVRAAERSREYELVAEGHHILADMDILESQKAYAAMLEKGDIITRDLDEAMRYYYMAAEKNDALSAFRYSRLAERTNEQVAFFWLSYAAALGCVEAYPVFAYQLSKIGDEDQANYYYAMSAAYDDTDSIVTLAKRYFNGTGCEQNLGYAKWYMDKLMLPPIHAIKMAYKLRTVKAEDPGIPQHPNYDRMLRRLSIRAHDFGYKSAYRNICSILSDKGDMQARMILGMLYAEGIGCEQNISHGLSLLNSSAAHGNAEAYKRMGDIYLVGDLVETDIERAIECYKAAAGLGMTNAYEVMGDIFYKGELTKRDVAKAIELYEMGAKEGHSAATEKAEALKRHREELYERGKILEFSFPEEAFKSFAIAANMGYVPAYKHIAACFRDGRGQKKDRTQAFLWFERAVESGDEYALYDYALCFSRGIGTNFDFKKAIEAHANAYRHGFSESKSEIERLMSNRRKHLVETTYSKAISLIYMKKLEEAAELLQLCLKFNHAKGIYTLGCLNEFGLGIPTDREKAFSLYETAFELKFRDPRAVYKLCILRMARTYK